MVPENMVNSDWKSLDSFFHENSRPGSAWISLLLLRVWCALKIALLVKFDIFFNWFEFLIQASVWHNVSEIFLPWTNALERDWSEGTRLHPLGDGFFCSFLPYATHFVSFKCPPFTSTKPPAFWRSPFCCIWVHPHAEGSLLLFVNPTPDAAPSECLALSCYHLGNFNCLLKQLSSLEV